MSCKALQLKGCEIAGSTFQGRKFSFPDRNISRDVFTAKVKGLQSFQSAEISGVIVGNDVYFSFSELEGKQVGSYKIEYWADFKDLAKEMIAVENFRISSEPCNCEQSRDANFTLEFSEETISYSMDISVINIGGGGGIGQDGKSAYELAVENGFVGTLEEWLESLKGEDGAKGDAGKDGKDGEKGDAFTYEDFTPEQLSNLKGEKGDQGERGLQGEKGADGQDGTNGQDGADGYTPIKGVDYFDGQDGQDGEDGTSVYAIEATDEAEALSESILNPNNIYFVNEDDN